MSYKIQRNEKLYAELDLQLFIRRTRIGKDPVGAGVDAVDAAQTTKVHSVLQDGLLYYKEKTETAFDDEANKERLLRQAFDGSKTVALYPGYANVHDRRFDHPTRIRPHMLLLHGWNVHGTLSEFMLRRKMNSAALTDEWSVEGNSKIGDIDCVHLKMSTRASGLGGVPTQVAHLYLAVDYNYLPVLVKALRPPFSDTVPLSEGIAFDMRRLKPGIWLPFKVLTTDYDPMIAHKTGQQERSATKRITVEVADLQPAYAATFFQVDIPAGTKVYHVPEK